MKVKIIPNINNNKSIRIPSSKSVAHRNVICASLSSGLSIIENIDLSNDIEATISCMEALGAKINVINNKLYIEGIKDFNIKDNLIINCEESGSTLRFLIPIFALFDKEVVFKGKGRLLERPLDIYKEIFDKQGLLFSLENDGLHIKGPIKPDEFVINGNVSSQFISGLLFALPLLNEDSYIRIIPPFESKSYVDITLDILEKFGIKIVKINKFEYKILKNQTYTSGVYFTEGDFSQMSFFLALGLINSELKIEGLNANSLQGDKEIIEIVSKMNGKVSEDFRCFKSDLISTEIDLNNCPDLGPIIMAIATQATGKTHIFNAKRLRIKESDRIFAMESELKKLGCNISSNYDEVFIEGKTEIEGNVVVNSHNDHRIVMALSILSTIAKNAVTIENAEAINKSYPNFFNDLRKLGIEVIEYDI